MLKIKEADLLSTDDNNSFSLQKYFRSYLKIEQRSKENSIYSVFSESEMEDVIVITNTDFHSDRLKNNFEVDQEKDIEADKLLKVCKEQNARWQKSLVYKLKYQESNSIVRKLKPIFENTSDFYKLVEELAEHILTEKQIDRTGLFKDYYYPLTREVLKIPEPKKLPTEGSELQDLVDELVDRIKDKKQLTISDFEDHHIALAKTVINTQEKNFYSNFIKKESNFNPLLTQKIGDLNSIRFDLSSAFGAAYYLKFLPKFIDEDVLPKETTKFRNALINEITFRQNEQEPIKISDDFGISRLSSYQPGELIKLAEKVADYYIGNKPFTIIPDFEDSHVALATVLKNIEENKPLTISDSEDSHAELATKRKFNFQNAKKDSNEYEFKQHLKDKIEAKTGKPITYTLLEKKEFEVSLEFGISELPTKDSELQDLADKLADYIKDKKQLTISDFKDSHVALGKEVVDTRTGNFHKIFIHGKVKKGDKSQELSSLAKQFRRILLDKMIDAESEQVKRTKESLKAKEIKVSKGFVEEFKKVNNPKIEKEKEFAEQIKELLTESKNKLVKINKDSKVKGNFETFTTNIQKLAGYVLINKFNKVRFSTGFLCSDELPGNLKNFKDELKKLLGEDKFKLISEYELDIKIEGFKFKTCEEGALDRKLPILHNEGDITDFFKKLKFVVNYPNKDKINNLLEGEIRNKLEKLDSKAFHSLYEKEMHYWLADRVGTFYTAEKTKKLFDEIEDNISFWTMDGVTKSYFATVSKEYEFKEYSDLTKFLRNEKLVYHHVFQNLQLGRIRIVQTFQELQKTDYDDIRRYTLGFGHIFVYLKQLLQNDFCSEILKWFKNDEKGNLIVIECDTEQEIQGLYTELSKILNANKHKKIILITREGDALANQFANDPEYKDKYKKQDDIYSFSDLTEESQKKLLEKEVTFQGKKISFNELIDTKELQEVKDPETLAKLINNEEIKIGDESTIFSGYDPAYYIERFFEYQVKITTKIFEDKKISDLFAISNIRGEEFHKLIATSANQISADQINNFNKIDFTKEPLIRFIILDNQEEEIQFQQLCQQYETQQNVNIHWLKYEFDGLLWQQSKGTISKLVQYRIDPHYVHNKITRKYSEKVLVNHNDKHKILIISDIAGMGKSTVLTSLSIRIKDEYPNLWVIRIDLNSYTSELDKLNNRSFDGDNTDYAINFLSEKVLKLKTKLEQELFKSNFRKQGKIALLFDGFDEISPDYKDVVINLLKALKKSHIEKIIITTRPYMRQEIEKNLEVFSYTLKPFAKENQIKFLTKFWQKKLEIHKKDEEKLKIYAEALIDKLISYGEQKHISIPLQVKMVAEVSQNSKNNKWEGCKDFLSSTHEKPKLSNLINLANLYEYFIDQKWAIYITDKKNEDNTNVLRREDNDKIKQECFKEHERLALHIIFKKEDLQKLLPNEQMETPRSPIKNTVRIGIIDNNEHFIHRTFAEYFVSKFLINILENSQEKKIQKFILADILVAPEYYGIRIFFNYQLESVLKSNNVLEAYGKEIQELYSEQFLHNNNPTILHFAAIEGNLQVMNFVFKSLNIFHNGIDYYIKKLTTAKDKYGNTPISLAVMSNHFKIVESLIQHGASITDKGAEDILSLASIYGSWDTVKLLIDNNADVNVIGIYNRTPLHYASENDRLEVVKLLIDHNANVMAQEHYGRTPLSIAALYDHWNIVNVILDNKNLDLINAQDGQGKRILDYAVASGKYSEVNDLIGRGVNVNLQDILKIAPLSIASRHDFLEIAELLITKGAEVNARDNNNRTALHYAAIHGSVKIAELLIKEGAKVNAKDNNKKTALHYAAANGSVKIAELLIKEGAKVNAKDNNKKTALHYAAANGSVKIAELLIKGGAKVNAIDKAFMRPIYYAFQYGHVKIVQWLFTQKLQGGDIILPSEELKLLFLAQKYNHLSMLEQLPNIFSSWKDVIPLREAVENNNLELVLWLIEHGANISIKDKEQKTALDLAIEKKI